jgi:pyruvoyl-dependent arginine decarboxylase
VTWFDTRAVILTSGRGYGGEKLVAFDAALRDARIDGLNLHQVTSIVPPRVPLYQMQAGGPPLSGDGCHTPAVYAKTASCMPGETMSAGVGLGIPHDRSRSGVIFTLGETGLPVLLCRDRLEAMVAEGMQKLRRTDGYDFRAAIATATAGRDGQWCAVTAALCFADRHLWRAYFRKHAEPLR